MVPALSALACWMLSISPNKGQHGDLSAPSRLTAVQLPAGPEELELLCLVQHRFCMLHSVKGLLSDQQSLLLLHVGALLPAISNLHAVAQGQSAQHHLNAALAGPSSCPSVKADSQPAVKPGPSL